MEPLALIILAMACLIILVCMSYYLIQMLYSESELFYQLQFSSPMTLFNKFIAIGAHLGFLVCFWQGANTLLFWIPDSWGWSNSGEYLAAVDYISTVLALAATIVLAISITPLLGKKSLESIQREVNKISERIENTWTSKESIVEIREDVSRTIQRLKADPRNDRMGEGPIFLFQERLRYYEELLRKADMRLSDQEAE